MRRWVFGSLAVLVAIGMLLPAGMFQPAWANSELHFGSRLFFPLWDVRGNRQTFIVLTREALSEGNFISQGVEPTKNTPWELFILQDNCKPRGPGFGENATPFGTSGNGNTDNINRTDPGLGGTGANPVFVDDVHLEYYGKTCLFSNEVIHMSCADIDLFLLDDVLPRPAFDAVRADQVGALDAHFIINGAGLDPIQRKDENSLMGTAIISDVGEGWAAEYPAAAAKSTSCLICGLIDGGTNVGYEPYPMEVFLPMVFADRAFNGPIGQLSNFLALWRPNLMPGGPISPNIDASLQIKFWDGRERGFTTSKGFEHGLFRTLGDPIQSGQDEPSAVVSTFNVSNFTCGHTDDLLLPYENDGFPRKGTNADAGSCLGPDVPDPQHKSDNFENGATLQPSNPIAWWRFRLSRDGQVPLPLSHPGITGIFLDHSGRGLVGVVLSTFPGASFVGVGDALRLWHKDPCNIAQSGYFNTNSSFGPPHVRDASAVIIDAAAAAAGGRTFLRGVGGSAIALFNTFSLGTQGGFCAIATEFTEAAAATGSITGDVTGLSDFVTTLSNGAVQ